MKQVKVFDSLDIYEEIKSRPDYACKDCEFKDGLLAWLQAEVKEGNYEKNT